MHPDKVRRDRLQALTDLPNVGPAVAADLRCWVSIDRSNWPDAIRGRCTSTSATSPASATTLA